METLKFIFKPFLFCIGVAFGVSLGLNAEQKTLNVSSDYGPRLVAEAYYAAHEILGKKSIIAPLNPRALTVDNIHIKQGPSAVDSPFAVVHATLSGESEVWTAEEFNSLKEAWADSTSMYISGEGIITLKITLEVHLLGTDHILVKVTSGNKSPQTLYSPYGIYTNLKG